MEDDLVTTPTWEFQVPYCNGTCPCGKDDPNPRGRFCCRDGVHRTRADICLPAVIEDREAVEMLWKELTGLTPPSLKVMKQIMWDLACSPAFAELRGRLSEAAK